MPSRLAPLFLVSIAACFSMCAEEPRPVHFAGYTPTSPWMMSPELSIEFVRANISFWMKSEARDDVHGGFYSNITNTGTRTDSVYKSIVTQSRHAYAFTRAFMLTGDTVYLRYARDALQFQFAHGWDSTHGGWRFLVDRNGAPVPFPWSKDLATGKDAFVQQYALLGPVAFYEATRDSEAWEWVGKGSRAVDEHMWDTARSGYYGSADGNWSNPGRKTLASIVDAFNVNTEPLCLLTGEDDRMLALADDMVDHMVVWMGRPEAELGFPVNFESDWTPDVRSRETFPHKVAWCIGRAYCHSPEKKYRDAVVKVLTGMDASSSHDTTYGGFHLVADWKDGVIVPNKEWVYLESAILSNLIGYHICDDSTYRDLFLRLADESVAFYMDHIRDTVNGGVFHYVSTDGDTVLSGTKGDFWSCSYHETELGYYLYLYTSLFVLKRNITLCYEIAPSSSPRDIVLAPLAMRTGCLRIRSVSLDGKKYRSFVPRTCILHIDAGRGGIFRVTFGTTG
jgi:mannose/cellobiose epimerase-like protein (N-acyl-D-glucosamine 2-epimerase family)